MPSRDRPYRQAAQPFGHDVRWSRPRPAHARDSSLLAPVSGSRASDRRCQSRTSPDLTSMSGRERIVERKGDGSSESQSTGAMRVTLTGRSSWSPASAASSESTLRGASPTTRTSKSLGNAPLSPDRLAAQDPRSEEHTSELQSRGHLVCRLLLEKKNRSGDTRRQRAQ